jgi:transmembrane sensor
MSPHHDDDSEQRLPDPDTGNRVPGAPGDPDALLDRHLAGETSQAEDELVARRYGDDLRGRVASGLADEDRRDVDSAAAWSAVRDRIRAEPMRVAVRAGHRWASYVVPLRIAAGLMLLAGGATLATRLSRRTERSPSPSATVTAVTGTGERRELLLPDGTHATLAPRSRLEYATSFGSGPRDVRLSGEAFFSVAHDSMRPFTVHTTGATARVLGTEFGVRAPAGAPVDVYVASGRVRVQPAGEVPGPVLGAGDIGRVSVSRSSVDVTHGNSLAEYLAWRDGRIVANAQPVGEVLSRLGSWFDVHFVVADQALASRPVSVDLRVGGGASVESALDALALVLDARWSRDGRTVTLRSR